MPRSLAKPELQCDAHAIKIHTAQSSPDNSLRHALRSGGIGGGACGGGLRENATAEHEFRFHNW